jgi:hypothetical protein
VVAPPGGFEDAVRRGRRRRRKQTGGSSALALVLAGVLAFSVAGQGGDGTDRLRPADDPGNERIVPLPGPVPSTEPTPHATPTRGPGDRPRGQALPTARQPVAPPPSATVPSPTRAAPEQKPPAPPSPGRKFAKRNGIEQGEPSTNTDLTCLEESAQPGDDWCAVARGMQEGDMYRLEYALCRPVETAAAGTLSLRREPKVEFVAVDEDHDDPVWTYTRGQRVVAIDETVTIGPGQCVVWWTLWDGYDDYGLHPPAGDYTVTARLLSEETVPAATSPTFVHE